MGDRWSRVQLESWSIQRQRAYHDLSGWRDIAGHGACTVGLGRRNRMGQDVPSTTPRRVNSFYFFDAYSGLRQLNTDSVCRFSYLFILSAQLMGLGLAGMSRSLFVHRADAIWPNNLSICAMLNTLHAGDDAEGYFIGPSRLRLFATVVPLAGLWMFLPGDFGLHSTATLGFAWAKPVFLGYLFTAVSYFSVICWIWPSESGLTYSFCPRGEELTRIY